ncbi:hypothetical protein MsAg5_08600 [Methanosarcinaceae archaeon Ag5]|uniref:Peptidase metallopeptidase domain-containing protein n=1 Tax=Methanolapillus africanus TaxID=3028297 RepID=A0AAE4SCZ5_9EURY|nr:hypothetical protein [Methanosarcinaceae archaeon Ag5]
MTTNKLTKALPILIMVLFLCAVIIPAAAYSAGNYTWYNKTATIKFESSFPTSYQASFLSAANKWSNAGSNFRFATPANQLNVSVYMTYYGTNNSTLPWLAQAQAMNFERQNNRWYINDSDVRYNTYYANNFTTSHSQSLQNGYFNVERLALHELGHALGLEHSNVLNAIMKTPYKYLSFLSQDDINGVKNLYGTKSKSMTSGITPIPEEEKQINEPIFKVHQCYAEVSDQELAQKADLVIRGTVKGELPAHWVSFDKAEPVVKKENSISIGNNQIVHDVVISVDDVYKGKLSENEIYIRQIGGTLDGITMVCDDQTEYSEGESVILYLFGSDVDQKTGRTFRYVHPQGELKIVDEKTAVNGFDQEIDTEKMLSIVQESL